MAHELSCHIARVCRGAAYDLNRDIIIWPKKSYKRFAKDSREERIELISLDWFIRDMFQVNKLVRIFLGLVSKYCVEALPKRFGTHEPFQYRYSASNEFIEMCDNLNKDINTKFLFWNANSPCFGGSIIFPDRRKSVRPRGAYPCIKISLSFDGRAILYDNRWLHVLVGMFTKIATALNAFYGAGYTTKNVIAKNNSVLFDAKSEESPLVKSKDWVGLPEKPVWLSWYGEPYMELVKNYLKKHKTTIYPKGILLKLNDDPFDIERLEKNIHLPKNLMVSYDVNENMPGLFQRLVHIKKTTSISLPKKIKAAEFVPSLP